MLCCDVLLKENLCMFCVTDKYWSMLLGSKVPMDKEYNSPGSVMIFPSVIWGGSWNCVLSFHSQYLCRTYPQKVSWSGNILPNGSYIETCSMWIHMQGINLLLEGKDWICHRPFVVMVLVWVAISLIMVSFEFTLSWASVIWEVAPVYFVFDMAVVDS